MDLFGTSIYAHVYALYKGLLKASAHELHLGHARFQCKTSCEDDPDNRQCE